MRPKVRIACFTEGIAHTPLDSVVVAVDVFRATTTAVTCIASGRRCLLAADANTARRTAARLFEPILIGEVDGAVPEGFDEDNSPATLALRSDVARPAVLISSSGVPIMMLAGAHRAVYAASLRNTKGLVEHLLDRRDDTITVVGAGTKGQFREEDQLGAAWVAAGLLANGYDAADAETSRLVHRWEGEPVETMLCSPSVTWLLKNGKGADIAFVLEHVDDLLTVPRLYRGELIAVE
jgi:2-phosphosulfolactate phosphatase